MQKLTHREEEVMRILWKLKKAFVKDIIEEMDAPKPPYNTISSVVRKLETAGHVGYEAFGKTHRYYPILEKDNYRKASFSNLLSNYFGGSAAQLLSYFVQEEQLTPDEIKELLSEIQSHES